MRKRIGWLLCAVMIVQILSVGGTAAAENADIHKEQTVLNRLGILEVGEADDMDAAVTRGEFVSSVANAIQITPVTDRMYFTDVPVGHWAAGAVNALVEAGLINGTEQKRFEPEESITYEQACKILVSIAGYKAYAEDMDAGMTGYTRVAQRIDIAISPSDPDALRLSEVVRMLYNTMEIPMAFETGVQDGQIQSEVRRDKTLFSVYHDVYVAEGRVETIPGASLDNTELTETDQVIIGGETYLLDADLEIDDLFGRTVEYLYIQADEGPGTLIYAEACISDEALTIEGSLITGFDLDSYAVSYYPAHDSYRTQTRAIARGAKVIFNGRILEGSLSEQIAAFAEGTAKGSVTLISDSSATADLVLIKSYRTYIAGNYDAGRQMLYNSYDHADTIDLEGFSVRKIRNSSGAEVSMPAVFPAAFSIAASEDGYAIELILCSEQAEAAVESVQSAEREVYMEGTAYTIDQTVYPHIESILNAGSVYRVNLDIFGEIVMLHPISGDMQLGYLRGVNTESTVFSHSFELELYMQDQAFHAYPLANRITVDGVSFKESDYEQLFGSFPGETQIREGHVRLERQVIRFKLNSQQEITQIDTYNVGPEEDADNTLTRRKDGSQALIYTYQQRRFGLSEIYDSGTTSLFVVPTVNAEGKIEINGQVRDDDVAMYNTAYSFVTDRSYNIESYYYDGDQFAAGAIVLKMDPVVEDETVFMFDQLSQAVNAEGVAVNQINGVTGGANVTYLVDESVNASLENLHQGDIIRVNTDMYGTTAVAIEKMFDVQTMTFENGGSNEYWYGGTFNAEGGWAWRQPKFQLTKTYVYDIKGGFVKGSYELADARRGITNETINTSGLGITIYDPEWEAQPIYGGNLSDILTYCSAGDGCSVMVANNEYTVMRQLFIYK